MGTYAITLPNLQTRISEKDLLVQSQVNVYSTGNTYTTQELYTVNQDETTVGSSSTKSNSGQIVYNENLKRHYFIGFQAGGTGNIMELLDESTEWKFKKTHNNTTQGGVTPDKYVYSKKYKTYYSCREGLAEWDENNWVHSSRGDASAVNCIAYDSKRDLVLSFAIGYGTGTGTNKWLTTYDPSVVSTTLDPYSGMTGEILLSANYLHNITAMGQPLFDFNHLSYSKYDDFYYFAIIGAIYKTDPTSGATSLVYTVTGELLSLSFDGDSKYVYMLVETTTSIKLEMLDLTTYTVSSTTTVTAPSFVKITFATIYYVKDVVLVLINSESGFLTSNSILAYNKDTSLDLVFQKRLYENWAPSAGSPQLASSVSLGFGISTQIPSPNQKTFLRSLVPQNFKELSGNKTEVHVPVFNSVYGNWNKSSVLSINPVVQYPTVTTPVVDDCCLSDLICDVKYKLAKNSCEATKRSIVGRHFKNVWDNSQTLEAILWITTFDCLSCDEIEKLKCIISKI